MRVIVSNSQEGPVVWEYTDGKVERLDLIDFNTHVLLGDNTLPFTMRFPPEIYDKILCYTMEYRLETRNFYQAFDTCIIDRRSVEMFYKQIYNDKKQVIRMITRLSRTFQFADALYEDYILKPNPNLNGMCAVVCIRKCSLRLRPEFEPWDFCPELEVQKLEVEDGEMNEVKVFPGDFHGAAVWIHGEENDGIYNVRQLHHPAIALILCDYTFALIPSKKTISINWRYFTKLLYRAFGPNTGIYMMIKGALDHDNPFIELTDVFLLL